MNGVIIDDEKFQEEAWRQFCSKYGLKFAAINFRRYILGRTNEQILGYLFGDKLDRNKIDRYIQERSALVKNLFVDHLKPIYGLVPFLEDLRRSRVKIGLATSSKEDYIDFILDGIRIRDYFDVIVNGDQVKKGKPFPDIYLLVARRLGTAKETCVVFEDSITGIKSAKTAGMKVVALTTSYSESQLYEADRVITSFADIKVSDLENLIRE